MGSNLITENFQGGIILRDWWRAPDGRTYIGAQGTVSILEVKEALGFDPGKGEANWCARVVGPSGMSVTFAGCTVRGILAGANGQPMEIAGATDEYWPVP